MNTIKNMSWEGKAKIIMEGGKIYTQYSYNKLLKEYYEYLINERNNSYRTIISKITYNIKLIDYIIKNNLHFKKIKCNDIYSYVKTNVDTDNYSLSIREKIKIQLREFFNWCFDNNYSNISGDVIFPVIVRHYKEKIRTYYTKEEITKLINAIDRRTNKGKEDFLIISLICYYGLRISDVVNLKISDFNFNEKTLNIIQYKTKEKLQLPLIDKVKYPLLDYLKNVRPNCNLDFVFINNDFKQKVEIKNEKIVKYYLIKAGINIDDRKCGFHSLRHSFSTLLLSENVPLYSISNILGHTSVETTMNYLDIDISKLKELALEVPDVR